MKTLVIMPGGFHPWHSGHSALYQAARAAFPDADVYVASTNDTSERPFPFKIKEKLATLAGVESGRFVQVKSPFQSREITAKYDPEQTVLVFVRSDKDKSQPPQPGSTKKDGSPAYLQPYPSNGDLLPMAQRGYMAYLPTIKFSGGMTSASEIRAAWPTMTDEQKKKLVNSLYPAAQSRTGMTDLVIRMLDQALGGVNEAVLVNDPRKGELLRPDGGMGTWSEKDLLETLIRDFRQAAEQLRIGDYAGADYLLYQPYSPVRSKLQALSQLQQYRASSKKKLKTGQEVDLSQDNRKI
jgi:hypothetical protein